MLDLQEVVREETPARQRVIRRTKQGAYSEGGCFGVRYVGKVSEISCRGGGKPDLHAVGAN